MSTVITDKFQLKTLAVVYDYLKQRDADIYAGKILDLWEKRNNEQLNISFAGHFSAGKSTMINKLMGETLLPESPIPTSANVVKISSGPGHARIFFKKGAPVQYTEPYDLDKIKSYCKDGDAIIKVEIDKPTNFLPDNVSIMDTPGIDSSKDADRVVTESALHLVDILYYVMDYNHVQSEVNLAFLREMCRQGKHLNIVINQIDKHNEKELSFTSFQEATFQVFRDWDITPNNVYFTSLFQPDHLYNQFTDLQKDISRLMNEKQLFVNQTVGNSAEVVLNEYLDAFSDQLLLEKQEITSTMTETDTDSYNEDTWDEAKAEIERLENFLTAAESEAVNSIDYTLKNAYLMPSELRESARLFLESRQDKFKPGFFSTKKKIEEERTSRLKMFHSSLMKTIEVNIQWKLRDKLLEFAKNHSLNDPSLLNLIHDLKVEILPEELISLVKPGAGMTGQYLLVYTEDLSNHIKKVYKQEALNVLNELLVHLEENINHKLEEIKSKFAELEQTREKKEQIQQLDLYLQEEKNELSILIHSTDTMKKLDNDPGGALKKREEELRFISSEEFELADRPQEDETDIGKVKEVQDKHRNGLSIDHTIEMITDSLKITDGISGLKTIKEELKSKRNRLSDTHFTVALFGAFSAGKSSFANALMGAEVLPVSPNPTTASINKISPPTVEHEHGTVKVQMKKEDDLLHDIGLITERAIASESLSEIVSWLKEDFLKNNQVVANKHRNYLHAVVDGFTHAEPLMGQEILIDFHEFSDYAANESIACYVEWMELYYDCPLTRQGITLVDTPGADSINSRHTDVSFEYIKQADAILFVTYYNHAFSKADRDFLIQLGRVKDAFSLDKMFFLINAADLAKNDEEVKLVSDYVSEQLLSFGIRSPKLFPVSSLVGMEEKLAGRKDDKSGLFAFEASFYDFINKDLTDIMIHSSIKTMTRLNHLLASYIESAAMDKERKKEKKDHLETEQQAAQNMTLEIETAGYEQEIMEKIEKQLFYVKERMGIQFNDRFKEHFNPATVGGSGQEAKQQITVALKKLIQDIGMELSQELRAVALRIGFFLDDKVNELNKEISEGCLSLQADLIMPEPDSLDIPIPEIHAGPQMSELVDFHGIYRYYRGQKSFFEKNEKEIMKERIYEILSPWMDKDLEAHKQSFQNHYGHHWLRSSEEIKTSAIATIDEYYEGILHTLTESIDMEQMRSAKTSLENVLKEVL
ncbi:dynamin family protein [Sediminibacillus massiliensis]|uniref:dynamin family protein n=1 Tax=Sediminibacillus massiliensis TaxID=1926277 RepID=UPI00098849A2|nr:dynamin family protein [Sediminibacillus massiliensis]